jgi:DNA mismatch repair protein MutS
VALIVLMAHMGSFVPAASAQVGLTDRIFVRAGATDDIAQGRSTFLVEMSETAHILRHATPRSLVVLDEVGRGTSTYDGVGLAWAVGEFLHDEIRARTLFATHFHELTALADEHAGARNVSLAVAEQGGEIVFLRQVVPGGADRSYGVQVARLAGLPERVIARATEVMNRLEQADDREVKVVREVSEQLLLPADDETAWTVLQELYGVDIANLTPVQALVMLNRLQRSIKNEQS